MGNTLTNGVQGQKEDVSSRPHNKDNQPNSIFIDENGDIFQNDVLDTSIRPSIVGQIFNKTERNKATPIPKEPDLFFDCDFDGFLIPSTVDSSKSEPRTEKDLHKGFSYIIVESHILIVALILFYIIITS